MQFKKKTSRLLSLILAVALMVTAMPGVAFAEGETPSNYDIWDYIKTVRYNESNKYPESPETIDFTSVAGRAQTGIYPVTSALDSHNHMNMNAAISDLITAKDGYVMTYAYSALSNLGSDKRALDIYATAETRNVYLKAEPNTDYSLVYYYNNANNIANGGRFQSFDDELAKVSGGNVTIDNFESISDYANEDKIVPNAAGIATLPLSGLSDTRQWAYVAVIRESSIVAYSPILIIRSVPVITQVEENGSVLVSYSQGGTPNDPKPITSTNPGRTVLDKGNILTSIKVTPADNYAVKTATLNGEDVLGDKAIVDDGIVELIETPITVDLGSNSKFYTNVTFGPAATFKVLAPTGTTVTGTKGEDFGPIDINVKLADDYFISDVGVDYDVTTWFTGLPAGLTATVYSARGFVGDSGPNDIGIKISGKPDVATTSDVPLSVLIPGESSDSVLTTRTSNIEVQGPETPITISIEAAEEPLEILIKTDLTNQTVIYGEPVTLAIVAETNKDDPTLVPLTYKWYTVQETGSETLTNLIVGANESSYTLPANMDVGTYKYFCIVSAEGAVDVDSKIAEVTVGKASYSDVEIESSIEAKSGTTNSKTVILPAPLEGGSYGAVTVTPNNDTFFVTTPTTLPNNTLAYTIISGVSDGAKGTITIPVTGMKNHADYNIVITVTATTAQITSYTVTYSGNGETGGTAPASATIDGNPYWYHTVIGNTGDLVKTDYTFAGWSMDPNATEAMYQAGATITVSDDITLYAVWESSTPQVTEYTLTYDANGGENAPAAATGDIVNGTAGFTIVEAEPTREGHTFLGWSLNKNATEADPALGKGKSIAISKDTTIYAVWEEDTTPTEYTITYEANNGTGSSGSVLVNPGTEHTINYIQFDAPTGKVFDKWNTEDNGSGTSYYPGDKLTVNRNYTLYAIWKDKPVGEVPVTGISIVPGDDVVMVVGDTYIVDAVITPSNASNKGVIWESIDESIATVNNNGKITATGIGETVIYASSAEDYFIDDFIMVTVIDATVEQPIDAVIDEGEVISAIPKEIIEEAVAQEEPVIVKVAADVIQPSQYPADVNTIKSALDETQEVCMVLDISMFYKIGANGTEKPITNLNGKITIDIPLDPATKAIKASGKELMVMSVHNGMLSEPYYDQAKNDPNIIRIEAGEFSTFAVVPVSTKVVNPNPPNYNPSRGGPIAVSNSASEALLSTYSESYTLGSGDTVSVRVLSSSKSVQAVKFDGETLAKGIDYTVSGSVYSFAESFLESLSAGDNKITFDMNSGTDPVFTIKVSSAAAPVQSTPPTTSAPSTTPAAPARKLATPTSNILVLDGVETSFPAYNVDDYNWLKLRDLAMILNGTGKQFSISFDAFSNTVTIVTGPGYTAVGDELQETAPGSMEAISSPQRIIVDGISVELSAYNINGYNYIRLRDLADLFDFGVTFNEGKVELDLAAPYVE